MATRKFKQVTFNRPFKLPSVGTQMPAGVYNVVLDTDHIGLHGHTISSVKTYIVIPPEVIKPGDEGCSALLMKGELEKALAEDRK